MVNMPEHIAILVCDTAIAGITSRYGDFGDNCSDLLLQTNKCPLPVIKYQIAFEEGKEKKAEEQYLSKLNEIYASLMDKVESRDIRSILLTGSRSDSFATDIIWIQRLDKFIKFVITQHKDLPLVGLCFGHQIICKNLGCEVGRNIWFGYECGTTEIEINKEALKIYEKRKKLNLVEFHSDIVKNLPPHETCSALNTRFESIGSSAKCKIQGIVTVEGKLKILTFQSHPEFGKEIALDIIKCDLREGLINLEEYSEAFNRTKNSTIDGTFVGEIISNFINEAISSN